MRKFLAWCLATLAAGIFAIVGSVALISCEKTGPAILNAEQSTIGVEEVANCLDSIVNPRLKTTKDVFALQNKLMVNAYIDSVFMSLDQKTLENVSSVILGRLHYVTKDDIVAEFVKNRNIYENLPKTDATPPDDTKNVQKTEEPIASIQITKEGTTTVTEAPPTRVEEKPAGYKDTTVNGKHALISVQ